MAHPDQRIIFAPLSEYEDDSRFVRPALKPTAHPSPKSKWYGPASPPEIEQTRHIIREKLAFELDPDEFGFLFNHMCRTWHGRGRSEFYGHVVATVRWRFNEHTPEDEARVEAYREGMLALCRARNAQRRLEGSTVPSSGDPATRRPPEKPPRRSRRRS